MTDVKEIEWQGGIYNIADEVARGEAQQARALANTAQTTAERALTAAGNAQNAAGAAQDSAEDAQITADAAKTTAETAQTAAENLNTRVSSIETALGYTTFQIPLNPGLIPWEGYNYGVKSGNTVTIRIGISNENLPKETLITTLPPGFRPKTNFISLFTKSDWTWEGSVEIETWGGIILRTPTSDGVYFTATFVV